MLRAGNLNERISILVPQVGRDELGAQVVTYTTACTVWADVKFQRGVQALTAGEAWWTRSISVMMRDNKKVDERCRLKWKGKVYVIESCNTSAADGSTTIVATLMDEGSHE